MKFRNKNGPSPFPGRCRKWWLNLASVFFVFILCCSTFFWLVNVCFCCVRFSFSYQAKRLAWRTSPKWPILCRVGRKTLTQPSSSGNFFCVLVCINNVVFAVLLCIPQFGDMELLSQEHAGQFWLRRHRYVVGRLCWRQNPSLSGLSFLPTCMLAYDKKFKAHRI